MVNFIRQMRALVKLSFIDLWRRHDMVGLLILSLSLMVPLAMATPFGAAGASRYLDEVALLLIWAFSLFIALGAGSRLFPPEFEARTIYPLLAKPISRGRLLVGKYLGAVMASWSAVAVFYLLFFGSIALRGGTVLTFDMTQAFALHLAAVAIAVAVSLLFSLVLSRSAALTLSAVLHVGMFLFGRELPHYADAVSKPLAVVIRSFYVLGPHIEFFDMRQRIVHGWGAVDGAVFMAAIGYAVVYVAILLWIAGLRLRSRE